MPYKDPEKRKEYQKQYHRNNIEASEYHKGYYKKNKEKWKGYVKLWQGTNHDKMLEQGRKRYWVHIEERQKRAREYFKTENGKANHQRAKFKRKTILGNVVNTLTSKEWLDILKEHNFRCIYCGKDLFDLFTKPEKDHVIPISKGGDNTKGNVVPTCRSCNAKKGDKILYQNYLI